jgi:hypothetical protein
MFLSRRRTRLRSTAVPTFFETVKPTRGGPALARSRACSRNAVVATLRPLAAARKSARCLNRSMGTRRGRQASGAQSLATARAAGRDHLAAARGCHAGAETVPTFAHQFARLISPLHGSLSPRAIGLFCGLFVRLPRKPVCAGRNRRAPLSGVAGRFEVTRLIRGRALAVNARRTLLMDRAIPGSRAGKRPAALRTRTIDALRSEMS